MSNLLIIDDDVDMLSSLTDVLAQAGYDVASASSGQDALVLAETRNIDLVISDVRMAGMDGIQCIERLCEGRPKLKSIVITGYASQDVPGRAMDLDSSDYLCKPFTAEQLIQSVSRALSEEGIKTLDSYPPEMQEGMASMVRMETTRSKAFQSYYLGIRSGHLGASAALSIWDHLETVELTRLEEERELQLRLASPELQDSYLTILEYCKSPAAVHSHKRKEGGVSRVGFQVLFNNIRSGNITPDQIKTAIRLRHKVQAQPSAPDQALYQLIWGGT
jgi:CheY-like chemotaxis protein